MNIQYIMRALRLLVILGNIGLFGMFIYLAISEGDVHGKFWLIFFAILSFFILNIYFIIFKNSDNEFSLEKIEKIFKRFKSDWIKENWFKTIKYIILLYLSGWIVYLIYQAISTDTLSPLFEAIPIFLIAYFIYDNN